MNIKFKFDLGAAWVVFGLTIWTVVIAMLIASWL